MIRLQMAVAVLFAALVLGGCSKDPGGVQPIPSDKEALQSAVTSIDSVADFSASDELTIDDNGMRSAEYDGLAKIDASDLASVSAVFADSVYPVRWGRHIFWHQVTRKYDIVISPGDSNALVTITKILPGEFWVGIGFKTADTVVIDTIIKKPFTEVVKRKVRFIRIARTGNPFRNWVPVAISMVLGKTRPDSLNHFSIASLEIERIGISDTTFTDPLQTWFRLGLFRGSIPRFRVGDSIRVRVTVTSSDDSAEISHLRFGIAGDGGERRRTVMHLISTSGGGGSFTRVYERIFVARLPRFLPIGVLAARFNAVVDVLSYGSIYVNDAPFTNEFWGAPYIVVR
ncbi:MAG TPA: hypothetical protein VES59_09595 [Bacteroidota bacterium]|nr:hypothetical protein [Bacteroidota bacterium]